MAGFLAAVGRAIIGRPVGYSTANAAYRSQFGGQVGEGGASRAATAGWAMQTWNDLFSRWFPSLSHAVTVSVNGSKTTPNNDVVHAALAIAFGTMAGVDHPVLLHNAGLKVKNDPIKNSCVVGFAISNASALHAANAISTLLGRAIAGLGAAIVRGVKQAIKEVSPKVPGVATRGSEKPVPPGVEGGGGGANNMLEAIREINAQLARQFGAGAAWNMGREEIRGARPPAFINPAAPKQPFDEMAHSKLWLTRLPAANPRPPAHDGIDLRTLVAQVLHDPGVRPPLPKTDKGPPVIKDELKGV